MAVKNAESGSTVESPVSQVTGSAVAQALGMERAGELRAHGADMDWDQALAYTLTQVTQALSQSGPAAQP